MTDIIEKIEVIIEKLEALEKMLDKTGLKLYHNEKKIDSIVETLRRIEEQKK